MCYSVLLTLTCVYSVLLTLTCAYTAQCIIDLDLCVQCIFDLDLQVPTVYYCICLRVERLRVRDLELDLTSSHMTHTSVVNELMGQINKCVCVLYTHLHIVYSRHLHVVLLLTANLLVY